MQCRRNFLNKTDFWVNIITICLIDYNTNYLSFSKGAASEREPVLSYVYKAYEHSHFPNFVWGLIGFYLLKIFIPLISIAGVIILTLILLSSSIILLLKLRHRDVVKASIDKMRNSSQSASSNFKVKREQNRLKKKNVNVKRRRA